MESDWTSTARGGWRHTIEKLIDETPRAYRGLPALSLMLGQFCLQIAESRLARKLLFSEAALKDEGPTALHLRALVNLQEFMVAREENPDRDVPPDVLQGLRTSSELLRRALTLVGEVGTTHQCSVLHYNLGLALFQEANVTTGEKRVPAFRSAADSLEKTVLLGATDRMKCEAVSLSAQSYLLGGLPMKALEVLRRVSDSDLDAAARSNLATALLLTGETAEALTVLGHLLEDETPPWQAIANVGIILLIANRPAWALRALRAARPHAGKKAWVVDHVLGKAQLSLGDYCAAERSFRSAIDLQSFDPSLYREHYEAFREGSVASLRLLISHLRDIFAIAREATSSLDDLEHTVNDAIQVYARLLGDTATLRSSPISLFAHRLAPALERTDAVAKLYDVLRERLSAQDRWTPHAIVEHVREVANQRPILDLPVDLPIMPEPASYGIDWPTIDKHVRGLASAVSVPMTWDPLETGVLARLLGPGAVPMDSFGHWLQLAARILTDEQTTPLLCYAFVRNVQHKGYQRRAVHTVLHHMHGRAILADEVGLGKTIEAGLLLTEYRLRHLVKRCLILVPSLGPRSPLVASGGCYHVRLRM